MPPKKPQNAKPQDLRDIIGKAAKAAKVAGKTVVYLNPLNPNGLSNDFSNAFLSKRELTKIVKGKGTKKDYAEVAATAASFAVPAGKIAKVIKVGKGLTRGSKVATKVVRGAANTAAAIGIDEGVRKGVIAGANKVKPLRKVVTSPKPKTKPKTKPKGK